MAALVFYDSLCLLWFEEKLFKLATTHLLRHRAEGEEKRRRNPKKPYLINMCQ